MRFHRLARVAAVVAAAFAVAASPHPVHATAQSAVPAPDTTYYYSLHVKDDHTAVVPHWITAFSAAMLEPYTTESRMQWSLSGVAGTNRFSIVNRGTGTCLEATGTNLVHEACDQSEAQRWTAVLRSGPQHGAFTYYSFHSVPSGAALTGGSPGWGGTPLVLASYAGTDRQKFQFVWRASA